MSPLNNITIFYVFRDLILSGVAIDIPERLSAAELLHW